MGLADLIFLGLVVALMVAILRIAAHGVAGRWNTVRLLGYRTSLSVAAYLAIVAAVSLSSPRRWIPVGAEQRFDDWGLTVERVDPVPTGIRVTVRVANHGRGRAQAARDAELLLITKDGREIAPSAAPLGARSLRSIVQAGDAFETERDFVVPPGTQVAGLDVRHGAWPEFFIVGDRGSLFAKRPLVVIPPISR